MSIIFKNPKKTSPRKNDQSPKFLGNRLTSYEKENIPIATISKEYIENKSIYKFFVRSSSSKEVIQTNLERVIFFLCNFKIYCIMGSKISIVDTGYKFRQINTNLIAYNTVDDRGKKTNEIKYISIGTSDYLITKVYEELDGKLVEFLV